MPILAGVSKAILEAKWDLNLGISVHKAKKAGWTKKEYLDYYLAVIEKGRKGLVKILTKIG